MRTDDLSRRLQASYLTIAQRYAVVNAAMPGAVLEALSVFNDLLHPITHQPHILDLGCGSGRDSAWFVHQGYRTTGVDLSFAMLTEARKLHSNSLVQADMQRIPVKSLTFDGLWANASLLHIPKVRVSSVLQECYRVLRQGAMIFIAVQGGGGEAWESMSYGEPAPRFFARYSADEFNAYLAKAGFRLERCDEQQISPQRHWIHFYATRNA